MTLYMKQAVFSWGDKFTVKDEYGQDRYYVQGEVFALGKKLHIYNVHGQEVAFIHQKLLSWMARYNIEIGGRPVCQVVQELALLRQKYRVEGLPWRMEGDFWAHEYELYSPSGPVMRLSKEWFTWGDSYELDIAEPGDELLCLCVALAVDCALAAQQAASNASTFPGT